MKTGHLMMMMMKLELSDEWKITHGYLPDGGIPDGLVATS